jgi:hypothetical protein
MTCQARSCNYYCSGKATSIAYSECVFVALGVQHAMRMRSIVLSSLASPGQRHFYKLSDKLHDFRKKYFWI